MATVTANVLHMHRPRRCPLDNRMCCFPLWKNNLGNQIIRRGWQGGKVELRWLFCCGNRTGNNQVSIQWATKMGYASQRQKFPFEQPHHKSRISKHCLNKECRPAFDAHTMRKASPTQRATWSRKQMRVGKWEKTSLVL